MNSVYDNILVERQGTTGVITINRPGVLNALNTATIEEISRALEELGTDDGVRAIVMTGAGNRAFVSGADIAELESLESAEQGYEHSRRTHHLLGRMQRLPKPVIMAVNGYALGGGAELAMAGDMIIAADTARFGQPEVNLGIIPGFGGTQRLPRLIGRTRALELILTGSLIDAEEAFRLGLVNRVVPAAELMDAALALANTIAEKGPVAVALAKRAVYEGLNANPTAGNDIETTYFGLAIGTEDRREGTQAFLEKRKPNWRNK